jgi:Relaxase/Mobilisation nuclease domain
VIASITRGKDAGALGVYLHGPGRHNEHAYNPRVHGMVIAGSVAVTDPTRPGQWVANMRRAYKGRDDVSRPVWQCSLRTAPGDHRLSDAEWADAAQTFAEHLGFAEHPWVAVRHADDHIHLAVSRVAHDGRVWQGQHDYRHAQNARRDLEVTYGLEQTATRRTMASERTPITQVRPGEYRMYADAGHHAPRVALAESVLAAANTTAGQGRAAFETELTDRGIHYVANQATTGTVSGYRFAAHTDDHNELVWFKASQLDKKLAWHQLSKVLEHLPAVVDERTFTREHDAELDRTAHQARAERVAARWAETGHPPVAEVTATLTEARTHLNTLDTHLATARAVVENQVGSAASQLADAQRAISSAGRLGRPRARHRFEHLATTYSAQLGVPVTGADGRQRSYAVLRDEVLSARHGDQLRERDHWAQVATTATTQLGVWERIQTDNPDYGAHGSAVARLVAQSFPHRDTPARRAYRDYLTGLPAPAVYPEREPSPAGAAILTDLTHPQVRQQRQQRLQDNLNVLRAYQHQCTPPPAPTRSAPRPTRPAPPPTINRGRDTDRGYGR